MPSVPEPTSDPVKMFMINKYHKYLGDASTGFYQTANSRQPVAQVPSLGPCSTCQLEPRETTPKPHLPRAKSPPAGKELALGENHMLRSSLPFPYHSVFKNDSRYWNVAMERSTC